MLYGGVTWSELPISTSREQEASGEEFEYNFIVDGILDLNLNIQVDKAIELLIDQELGFGVDIKQTMSKAFEIEQVQEFNLQIDKDNTWSLS